jgi:cytochrome b subunit of formate dehydrogenase
MMYIRYGKWLEKAIRWLLLVAIIFYMITGFGITEFRTVEDLTFGLLTKSLAFKIHEALWLPFIVLMLLHILLPVVLRHLGYLRHLRLK